MTGCCIRTYWKGPLNRTAIKLGMPNEFTNSESSESNAEVCQQYLMVKTQTSTVEAPSKKSKSYNFHPEWEEDLEQHHNVKHQSFKDSFLVKSANPSTKVAEIILGSDTFH